MRIRMAGWWRAAAWLVLASAAQAAARSYTVDDLLQTEAFGRILLSPGGRWLVFDRRGALADAARFDFNAMDVVRNRLYRVDLRHPGPAQPLVALATGAATIAYGFSPHGTRLAIARLEGPRWQLGVVTLASGAVRWFDVSPDYAPFRTTLGWLSEDRLVTIAQPGRLLPWLLRMDLQDARDMPSLWAATQAGRVPAVTVVGSGRSIEVKPRAAATSLLVLDVVTGEQHELAEGDLQSLQVAPDGGHVALIEQGGTIRISTRDPIREATDPRRRILRVIDPVDGHVWTPCASCDVPFAPPIWSPSGDSLLFFARVGGEEWAAGKLWRAELSSGGSAAPIALNGLRPVIIAQTGNYDAVGLGWMGKTPLLFARRGDAPGARADWYDPARPHAVTGDLPVAAARLLPAGADAPIMLAPDRAWRLGGQRIRRILSSMTDLKAAPASGRARTASGPAPMTVLGWRKSASGLRVATADGAHFYTAQPGISLRPEAIGIGGGLVATRGSASGAASLILMPKRGQAITLASINRHLDAVTSPTPLAIHHRWPDGGAATSWLYRPPRDPGAPKPPLIVIPYAGRTFGETPPSLGEPAGGRSHTNVSALVGHGYAVLLPSMPPLQATDQPFPFARQILSAVDAVIVQGLVDPHRLGLWGHSYGGFTAATVATQTDRFRAIVVADGLYDLASFQGVFAPPERRNPGYGQGIIPWAGWAETEQPKLGASPWTRPLRYTANSPFYQAGQITTPLMIIAADRDFAPLQQGEQLFSALYRQGKDAELVSYWGEGHALVSPANIRDSYARIFDWFDRHFADAPEPRAESARPGNSGDEPIGPAAGPMLHQ